MLTVLFHDFHVNALGQVGEGAVGVAHPYGLAEHVEYPVPGLAVTSLLYIADDGGACSRACRNEPSLYCG